MRTRPLYDYVALLARIGVGVVILAHGWQKIQVGITATSRDFERLRVPAPTAAAIYATFVELLGGVALILGLALPVAGLLLFADMAGAFAFVHAENGVFLVNEGTAENGFELVLVLGVASLLFAAGGAGRFTVDRRLFPRRTEPHPAPPRAPSPASEPPPRPASQSVRESAPEPGPKAASGRTSRKFLGLRRSGKASTKSSDKSSDTAPGGSAGLAADAPGPARPAAGRPAGTTAKDTDTKDTGTKNAGAKDTSNDDTATEDTAEQPRLVSSIVEDTSKDVLVAGRRKRRSAKKPADEAGQAGDEPTEPRTSG
ncbi:DoxX family protein [Actinomadura sp. HBU206391]|uniref:DoxX family protein n=1 Tax=Actinomadura sp. HBU206391 TaxID=2731692 RepID=UPI001650A275|nr:DoxX family protein [Actinomadura sp. HBU206391]MBC6461362.1 DoxX family protein [Actinomadura sp. HBU206391]